MAGMFKGSFDVSDDFRCVVFLVDVKFHCFKILTGLTGRRFRAAQI